MNAATVTQATCATRTVSNKRSMSSDDARDCDSNPDYDRILRENKLLTHQLIKARRNLKKYRAENERLSDGNEIMGATLLSLLSMSNGTLPEPGFEVESE